MLTTDKLITVFPLLKGVEENLLEHIIHVSHQRLFDAKQILFYEEEELPYWFFVIEGRLKAYKSTKEEHSISLCHLDEGMAVNDVFFNGHTYTTNFFATIESLEEGLLLGIKISSLNELFQKVPSFAHACYNSSLATIGRYQRAFYSGMVLDAMGKVAFMLSQTPDIFFKMKKQEVASQLNIQPETLSRILGKLARKGVISTQGKIKVTDFDGLKEFYSTAGLL